MYIWNASLLLYVKYIIYHADEGGKESGEDAPWCCGNSRWSSQVESVSLDGEHDPLSRALETHPVLVGADDRVTQRLQAAHTQAGK